LSSSAAVAAQPVVAHSAAGQVGAAPRRLSGVPAAGETL
jgi:hypothetical protein